MSNGRRDFDFLRGTWRIHNRRLRAPLSGSNEWYEFDGRSIERPLWNGDANIEEYEGHLPGGAVIRGLALRLYDPRRDAWTIHWSNAETGRLDPPMTGSFCNRIGEFFGADRLEGRSILLRFLWTSNPPDAARWEQAFSADGGHTWETNWIMEFERIGASA